MKTIALMVMAVSCLLYATDSKEDRATLQGIKSVCVVIEDPGTDANGDGLTLGQIRTDAELRLRKAGINVIDDGKGCGTFLSIIPHLIKATGAAAGIYLFNLDTAFYQQAVLSNKVTTFVPTWSVQMLGIVGASVMSRQVRDDIGDQVDQFINAYLSANPR